MNTITKEGLEPVIERLEHYATNVKWTNVQAAQDMLIAVDAMRIALASLEAEPAIHRWRRVTVEPYGPYPWHYGNFIGFSKPVEGIEDEYFYSAPPAPVSMPDFGALTKCIVQRLVDYGAADDDAIASAEEFVYNACRAAMLQGADNELQRKAAIHDALCEKYNVESLADFVEWQRNHIAELEAAPPAPVGEGEMAVMPDYPGYAMTQRECYQAGKSAGLADPVTTAYTLPDDFDFDRFNDVVWLEAVASNPHMHSLTTSTIAMVALELNKRMNVANSPVIPDGWVACSERMPYKSQNVLISVNFDSPLIEPLICSARYTGSTFRRGDVTVKPGEGVEEVTHWMPLPAAPQQESE